MTKANNYLLTIDVEQTYDVDKLKSKLDLAIDWLRVVPGCYFIHTTSDSDKWYERIKTALPNNRFFITQIDISSGEYSGWLPSKKWDWIKKYKN